MDCVQLCMHIYNIHKQRERERERERDEFKWSDHRLVVSTSQWLVFLATLFYLYSTTGRTDKARSHHHVSFHCFVILTILELMLGITTST